MIRNIPKPEISPAFTIDDIHKIRRWNDERMKDATPEERRAETEQVVTEFRREIAAIRARKAAEKKQDGEAAKKTAAV